MRKDGGRSCYEVGEVMLFRGNKLAGVTMTNCGSCSASISRDAYSTSGALITMEDGLSAPGLVQPRPYLSQPQGLFLTTALGLTGLVLSPAPPLKAFSTNCSLVGDLSLNNEQIYYKPVHVGRAWLRLVGVVVPLISFVNPQQDFWQEGKTNCICFSRERTQ